MDSPSQILANQVIIIRSKGQRSRLQGNKVQKHIEGNRVAGVCYALSIECTASSTQYIEKYSIASM